MASQTAEPTRQLPATLRPITEVGRSVEMPNPDPAIKRRRGVLGPHPTKYDPFILLGEDWFTEGAFSWHPHRGFETVTYVVHGQLSHRDTAGNTGVAGPGDVEWITAGSGIMHDEQPVSGEVYGLQLWLNLPSHLKMSTPAHQELPGKEMPMIRGPGFSGRVFGGTINSVTGPARTRWPATVADLSLAAAANVRLRLSEDQAFCIFLLSGKATINGKDLASPDYAWLTPAPGDVQLQASADCKLLIYGGKPIGEPVALQFPFVMNTEAEIEQAMADLEAGKFGKPGRN